MPLPTLKEQFARLIALPSVSCTQPSLDQSNLPVIEQLAEWFAALGFTCEIQPVAAGKANLVATLGQGPGGLVLAGHTDTVPFDEALWRSDPLALAERDGRWYGLGTCDMKGFFPLVIEAVHGLRESTWHQPLIVLATCDEESSMAGARSLSDQDRYQGRAAVIGEPTGLKPIRMHKGILMERIDILGQSGHSSNPDLGRSALEAMHASIGELLGLRQQWQASHHNPNFLVPVPTLNLGCIHGGDNPNRICGQCSLEFDLRPLPGMDIGALREGIRARLENVAERFDVRIDYRPLFDSVPAFEQAADSELVRLAERLSGHQAEAVAFATEAPYLQRLGCETIVLGPGDIACAHQPDEHLDLARIPPMLSLLRQTLHHYCLTKRTA